MGFTVTTSQISQSGNTVAKPYYTLRSELRGVRRGINNTTRKAEYFVAYAIFTYTDTFDYIAGSIPVEFQKHKELLVTTEELKGDLFDLIYKHEQKAFSVDDVVDDFVVPAVTNSIVAEEDLTVSPTVPYVLIDGQKTINTILSSDFKTDDVITLQFRTATTVKHQNATGRGAKIRLVGDTDFQSSRKSTLKLQFNGTTWNETARTSV